MRIKRIIRKNIYQHRDLDIEITGDVIALVGPNGSGKSNLLSSLGENEHGEFHQDKDRVVTRGAEKGFMEDTILLPDGRTYTVTRHFPTGKATFRMGDETITGAAKVNDRILRELGVEKSILQNIVFVGQQEIDAILFSRAGEKDRLAQKFFGLQKANVIEKALSEQINAITFDSADQQLTELLARQNKIQLELAEKQEVQRAVLGQEVPPEWFTTTESEIKTHTELAARIEAHKALVETGRRFTQELQGYETQYAADKAAFDQINPTQIDQLYEAALKAERDNAAIDRLNHQIETTAKAIEGLQHPGTSEAELAILSTEIEDIWKQITEKTQTRDMLKGILDAVADKPDCPTCRQVIPQEYRDLIARDIPGLNAEIERLTQEMSPKVVKRIQDTKALDHYTKESSKLQGVLESAQAERVRYGAIVVQKNTSNHYRVMREQYNQMAQALRTMAETIERVRGQLNANLADQSNYAAGSGIKVPGTDQYVVPKDVAALQVELQQARDRNQRRQEIATQVATLQVQLQEVNGQIQTAKEAAAENSVSDRFKKQLVTLRGIFHPEGAPRLLVTRNNQRLEGRLNQYLASLNAPFSVRALEGLNFECQFPDGVARDTELSVGQKVALAWSFRFSACETFSSSVGLMTLDEPTAPMDRATKASFNDIVEGLKRLSATYGMQFFLSTHDEALAAHCDQVIRLEGHQP